MQTIYLIDDDDTLRKKLNDVFKGERNYKFKQIKTENIEKPTTKFKNSPIISPVFGLDSNDNVSNIEVENTANLDKLSEEIKKTTEVLNTLKELRKNLQ